MHERRRAISASIAAGSLRCWRMATRHTRSIGGSLAGNDPIDALAVRLLRLQRELELLAHHGGKKPPHRVWLPAGGSHDCREGGAARPSSASTRACFEFARPLCWPLRAAFARTLDEACALAVRPRLRLDMQKTPLTRAGATSRRHHPNPAEAHKALAGERLEREISRRC